MFVIQLIQQYPLHFTCFSLHQLTHVSLLTSITTFQTLISHDIYTYPQLSIQTILRPNKKKNCFSGTAAPPKTPRLNPVFFLKKVKKSEKILLPEKQLSFLICLIGLFLKFHYMHFIAL